MLLPVVRASALMEIQRIRRLKYPGEVLVYEGQQVLPDDVIAETLVPARIIMVDIADRLGVDPLAVRACLVREPGEYLHEGDILAQITDTLSRLVRAPLNGRFTGLHQGKAVFEIEHRSIQVKAGMTGVVQTIFPGHGAVISASGFLLQGLWGNEAIGMGELQNLEVSWSRPLTPDMLSGRGEGMVIAAGSCMDAETLRWFGTRSSGGLIIGWMPPDLLTVANAMPVPIILMQGFGVGQPDSSLLNWLRPHAGKSVCLNASAVDAHTGMRPEALIPASGEARPDALGVQQALAVGQKVRVFAGGHWGITGAVLALPEGDLLFESGLAQPAAVVQLDLGEEITVPQQNLVILADISTD
ncbi:MAG: hypothetical protein GX142_02810 [Chloroflexi bacterium]|nr:hypothetical protein [Chloroflexota bacterium]